MPFIPHTEDDTREMLAAIGASSIDDLFDEIPPQLLIKSLDGVPTGLSEMEISRLMHQRAAQDGAPLCFIGAGAYEHHIPQAVWDIATRGEYYSAYTPYQAEASQGTLQTIYEYQTMITELTGLDVSNASLYDGASGLAEASLMAVRSNRKAKSGRILLAPGVNPNYEKVAVAIAGHQNITFERLPMNGSTGNAADKLDAGREPVALVIQQPSFPGTLEDVDRLTDWAHERGALVIAVVNPLSLALLKAPGSWGTRGADIAVGEGQPLGVPLSSGGPYFGFMTCRQEHVRQMPGRIVGRTTDLDDNPGFTLTLQAREQHIRRSKATSNICTNQGLMVTAATIYMSLLGFEGLRKVALRAQQNTALLVRQLTALPGVQRLYEGPHFHEVAISLDRPVAAVLQELARRNILGGYDLGNALLVCATETKTAADIDHYVDAMRDILAKQD
ncbi:MAG: aminomethyl-transferring glycine dehydrogenase subunit GcvPA [Gammaproteobacteria bacterium]|nr:aminomethyl-transferring glycine dehydrogenase subunit GcvPA [Gammaproteobacteria bacterium]MDH5302788.1 aminomethyl-transferring glycine dehydrogenase subunit GcvPA [Gammaproteobacteria bacterium]MDH5322348.1 aminomethyl-transferring glycine dehydrogenase subunit GcvPA [Gammaproteobacteria bacterium]